MSDTQTFPWTEEDQLARFGTTVPLGFDTTDPVEPTHAGKVVAITGAGNGLGAAHAWEFARRGAKLALSDLGLINPKDPSQGYTVDRVADALERAGYRDVVTTHDNVSDTESGGNVVREAIATFGQLDILIPNAGIDIGGPVDKQKADAWLKVYQVHAMGTVNCLLQAYKHFLERKYGCVLFVPSTAGLAGASAQDPYCAAKAALIGMMKGWVAELAFMQKKLGGHRIFAAAISPSAMTEMSRDIIMKQNPNAWANPSRVGLSAANTTFYAAMSLAADVIPDLATMQRLSGQVWVRRGHEYRMVDGTTPLAVFSDRGRPLTVAEIHAELPNFAKLARPIGIAQKDLADMGPFAKFVPQYPLSEEQRALLAENGIPY